MKIHSIFAEISIFLIMLLFFILPPIFGNFGSPASGEIVTIEWSFPFSQLVMASIALCIFLIYRKLRNSKINIFGFRILFTLGLLFASFFFINFLSYLVPYKSPEPVFPVPDSVITWIFCILNFAFAAFYEEVVYRFYFTDTLISLLNKISPLFENKITVIICEILGCVVFALAHSYLGIFAVINAAIAHFILRYTYKKSNSIIPGVAAHFLYNMISVILL